MWSTSCPENPAENLHTRRGIGLCLPLGEGEGWGEEQLGSVASWVQVLSGAGPLGCPCWPRSVSAVGPWTGRCPSASLLGGDHSGFSQAPQCQAGGRHGLKELLRSPSSPFMSLTWSTSMCTHMHTCTRAHTLTHMRTHMRTHRPLPLSSVAFILLSPGEPLCRRTNQDTRGGG